MPAGQYFEVMQKELIFLNLLRQSNNCSEVSLQIFVFRIAENILKTYALKSVSTSKGLHHMRLRDYFTKFEKNIKKLTILLVALNLHLIFILPRRISNFLSNYYN